MILHSASCPSPHSHPVEHLAHDIEHLLLLDGVERAFDVHFDEVQLRPSFLARGRYDCPCYSHATMLFQQLIPEISQRGKNLVSSEK